MTISLSSIVSELKVSEQVCPVPIQFQKKLLFFFYLLIIVFFSVVGNGKTITYFCYNSVNGLILVSCNIQP